MNDSISITKDDLRAALAQWEEGHRAGKTRTYDETKALPAEQVVDESTAYVWSLLTKEPVAA